MLELEELFLDMERAERLNGLLEKYKDRIYSYSTWFGLLKPDGIFFDSPRIVQYKLLNEGSKDSIVQSYTFSELWSFMRRKIKYKGRNYFLTVNYDSSVMYARDCNGKRDILKKYSKGSILDNACDLACWAIENGFYFDN